jgi:hypothetical protein
MERLQAFRARLGDSLFPSAPAGEPTVSRGEQAVLLLALLAIAVVLQLARAGWSGSIHSLWAEDGPIFLQEALTQDFWHAISSTYAGYLVLVPRLIAEVAALFPLRDAPAAISIASAAVVALSGFAVWHASAGHIRNVYLRGTLAILAILVPVASLESVDSAAYVAWYMLFATFWLLLWRPRTTWGAALGSLFILASALSSPGVWFFAPLAALRALTVRNGRDLAIVGSFAVGAAIQVPIVALNTEEAVTPLWTSDIWSVYIQRVVDGAALGQRLGGSVWSHLGWPFLIVLVIAAAAGLAIGAARSGRGPRYLVAIATLTSLLMFVVSVYQRAVGTAMLWPADTYNGTGGRYTIVPALLLVSAALVLIDASWRRQPQRGRLSLAGAAAAGVLMLGVVTSFDLRDPATRGEPPWSRKLDEAAVVCARAGSPEVNIPISPPGFGLNVPCDRVPDADAPLSR